MPIYEYKCENDHVFDVMQRMSENPLTECVQCGAPVRKVLQPVGISFKGSGFYSTDYNKKGPKPEKETTKTGDGATNGASSGDSAATTTGGSENKTAGAASPSGETAKKKAD